MKHKGFRVLIIVIACILLIIGFYGLERMLKEAEPLEVAAAPSSQKVYNNYGLPVGTELSQVKLLENDNVVCYEDRAFYRFHYEEENAENATAIVQGLLECCPNLEQIYVMPVPPRILAEEGYQADAAQYQTYIEKLGYRMPGKCTVLDVSENVAAHKEEYIFYRTEDAWTSRGAYYGAQVFLEETGRAVVPLEQYEEYIGNQFEGSMKFHEDIDALEYEGLFSVNNPLVYYWLKDSPDRVEIILFDDDGKKQGYKKALFTPSSVNLSSIIESDYARAVVEGKSMDGKKLDEYLLLIGDRKGKLLVPYLKDYYAGIIVIKISEDPFLYDDINTLIKEYNIKEVLWAQNSLELAKTGYYRALYYFKKEAR